MKGEGLNNTRDEYAEFGERLVDETRSLILAVEPDLRSKILVRSYVRREWKKEGWKIFRQREIVLSVVLSDFDEIKFQDIRRLVQEHIVKLLRESHLSSQSTRVELDFIPNKSVRETMEEAKSE
jgi:hypothetical protein